MAHLALVVDDDPDRRDRFVAGVRRLFAGLPGVVIAEERQGDLACVWACGRHAPVGLHREADAFAIVIGYAIADDGRRITARDLLADWLDAERPPGVYDGYHLGVAWSASRGLAAGVDPLGMFPFQWAAVGPGTHAPLVATTTPAAFACHPDFVPRIERRGLAGILLVHGPLADRPLLADTRRLPKGHRLRWSRDRGASEQRVYRVGRTPPPPGETTTAMHARIGHELLGAIRRHAPDEPSAILLSGGLDSRLVAACLSHLAIPTRAIALGRDDDFEVRAARAVARRLEIPVEVISTESLDDGFAGRMRTAATFNQLTSAPGADDLAEGVALAASASRWVWSGIGFDWIFEPVSRADGLDVATGRWAFDGLIAYMNRWGVAADALPALLGEDGRGLVEALLADLRAACLRGPNAPEHEAALLRWDQRVRNHIAMAIHRITFHSWPLLPATDRRFFEAMFSLPPAAFEDRVVEKAILRDMRPDLCAVPLDANSFRFEPPRAGTSVIGRLAASMRGRLRRLYWTTIRGRDPRRYERLFNVDHPRWLALRRDVEPLRPLLHRHLDERLLAAALPPPHAHTGFRNPVNQGGAVRLLLGLAMVLDDLARPA